MPSSLPARRRVLLALVSWGAAIGGARSEPAGAFPQRPLHLVVPNAVGGGSDALARLLQSPLSALLGQPIVLDYRPGAAGKIAYDYVAQSAPDGYTLLLTNNGTQNSVSGSDSEAGMERGASPRPLAPISLLARAPVVIAVQSRQGISSLTALVERARREPGRLPYASGSIGSTSHLAAMLLSAKAGIAMQHVPYAGTAAALKDVLSGEVPVMFTQVGTIAGLIDAGSLQPLAVTSERRLGRYPHIPTTAEAGFAEFAIGTWYGVMAPPTTPPPLIARLNDVFVRAMQADDVQRALPSLGMETVGSTPVAFAAALDAELQRSIEVMRGQENANGARP